MPDKKMLTFTKVLDAPRERVWHAWTDPQQVKKWWGPKGFTAPDVQLDFREGGKFLYTMHGPAGTEWDVDSYSAGTYRQIIPMAKIVATDYFSDAEGNPIKPTEAGIKQADFPAEMEVTTLFEDAGDGKTRLSVIYPEPATQAEYQAMLDSGMEEGWNSTLDKLAAYLGV